MISSTDVPVSQSGKPLAANPTNVLVIIPALNEQASSPAVIARLREVGLNRIRVVDNGIWRYIWEGRVRLAGFNP